MECSHWPTPTKTPIKNGFNYNMQHCSGLADTDTDTDTNRWANRGFATRLFLFCICFVKNSYDLCIVFIKNEYDMEIGLINASD